MVWYLHKDWGPRLPPLVRGAGVPRREAGSVTEVRHAITVESLNPKPVAHTM